MDPLGGPSRLLMLALRPYRCRAARLGMRVHMSLSLPLHRKPIAIAEGSNQRRDSRCKGELFPGVSAAFHLPLVPHQPRVGA